MGAAAAAADPPLAAAAAAGSGRPGAPSRGPGTGRRPTSRRRYERIERAVALRVARRRMRGLRTSLTRAGGDGQVVFSLWCDVIDPGPRRCVAARHVPCGRRRRRRRREGLGSRDRHQALHLQPGLWSFERGYQGIYFTGLKRVLFLLLNLTLEARNSWPQVRLARFALLKIEPGTYFSFWGYVLPQIYCGYTGHQ